MKTTFTKQNYLIFLGGIALLFIGYLLMTGGGSEDPNVFSPAIFDTRRITLAPLILVLGFVTIIVGIMWREKKPSGDNK
jgi:hypothetical protein